MAQALSRFRQVDIPEYLSSSIGYAKKFFITAIAVIKGENKLLTNNQTYASPHLFATSCITLSVALIKLYWPDDPIKTFELPQGLSGLSPLLNLIPLPWLSLLVVYVFLINIPMYTVSYLAGYNPRLDRIYRASVYPTMILSLYIVVFVELKYNVYSLFPAFQNSINSIFFWVNNLILLYCSYVSLRWMGIAHAMTGYRFFFYNLLVTGLPLVILSFMLQDTVAGKMLDQFYAPRPIRLFNMPSGHMWPNLPVGAEVIANQMAPNSQLKVGDVVVFNKPADDYPGVQRIVAMGGDRIKLSHGRVVINGAMLNREKIVDRIYENYFGKPISVPCYIETNKLSKYEICQIDNDEGTLSDTEEVTVPNDHLFLLGDNRENASDSRLSLQQGGIGFVPINNVIGKLYFALYPKELGYLYKPKE